MEKEYEYKKLLKKVEGLKLDYENLVEEKVNLKEVMNKDSKIFKEIHQKLELELVAERDKLRQLGQDYDEVYQVENQRYKELKESALKK